MKKTISIILALIMMSSVAAVAPVTAEAAITNSQIKIYKNKLNDIINHPSNYIDTLSGTGKVSDCKFGIADVNQDGTQDLIVQFNTGVSLGRHMAVYSLHGNSVYTLYDDGVLSEFYKGYVKIKQYHNQSPGNKIWPYSVFKYNSYSEKYDVSQIVFSAFCAERGYPGADRHYSASKDKDNDGVIYFINGEPKTKSEYNAYVNKYIPEKNKININFKSLTSSNVNALDKPSSVKLNRSSLGLGVGESYGLIHTVSPGYASKSVTWSSSNSGIAAVDKNGKVTGKKPGTANVTVKTSNGKTSICKVTVKAAPSSVKTNPASLKLGAGEKFTISESTSAKSYANAANLRWSSSNTSVAAIAKTAGTNKAVITARKAGTANITVKTYNGKSYTCKLTVYPAPSGVKLSKTSITLSKGKSYTISENTNSGSYANAANLKWSSTNTKVATVTKGSGNKATVKAVGKGTAYVKITLYNGKVAQCKVTVI